MYEGNSINKLNLAKEAIGITVMTFHVLELCEYICSALIFFLTGECGKLLLVHL